MAASQAETSESGRLAALRGALESKLRRFCPEMQVFGSDAARLPNTSCIAMPGVSAETQLMAFDLAGIAVSAGSACSSGKVRVSHVLSAMGVDPEIARTAIRVSLGWTNGEPDIERFAAAWSELYARTRRQRTDDAPAA